MNHSKKKANTASKGNAQLKRSTRLKSVTRHPHPVRQRPPAQPKLAARRKRVAKMKVLSLLLFIFFIGATCTAQTTKKKTTPAKPAATKPVTTKPATAKQPTKETPEMVIARIRKQYAKLMLDSAKWRLVKEDLEGVSTEGGEIRKYYRGDTLRKAIMVFYGETGKTVTDYYFWDRQLFFALERVTWYDKPLSGKVKKSEENRLYFDKQSLMRWMNVKGRTIDKDYYADKEKQVMDNLKVIRP